MSWMTKANIGVIEQLLTRISLGKLTIDQAIYQLSPAYCETMQSMIMTHPRFTDILNELMDALCPQQPEEVGNVEVGNVPEAQNFDNGDITNEN